MTDFAAKASLARASLARVQPLPAEPLPAELVLARMQQGLLSSKHRQSGLRSHELLLLTVFLP